MITDIESVQAEFAGITGADAVVADEAACRGVAVDGLAPKSVVYPQSAGQVAAALKCAAERDLAVIPCRNGTKLGIGNFPARYDVALSLKRLNNVWNYEPEDLTATVDAGMKLGDLNRLLERNGLWLPLDPQGGVQSSLGGILASNACGPLKLFYGAPRDMILGMSIATVEGKIIKAGGRVVKNVAGYDLTKLLIGSFGSLGVIVSANLKLFPLPPGRATSVFELLTLDEARDLRRRITSSPLTPMRLVLLNRELSAAAAKGNPDIPSEAPFSLWLEAGGTERVLDRYSRTLGEIASAARVMVKTLDAEIAKPAWERISDFDSHATSGSPGTVALRVLLPISAAEEFIHQADQWCSKLGLGLGLISLVGSGVVRIFFSAQPEKSLLVSVLENLRAAARDLRGTLVVEQCAPELKKQIDIWGSPGSDFDIMRKVKRAWDPRGTLSPGRLIGRL